MTGNKRSIVISKNNVHDVLSAFLLSIRSLDADEYITSVKFSAPKFEDGHYIITVRSK